MAIEQPPRGAARSRARFFRAPAWAGWIIICGLFLGYGSGLVQAQDTVRVYEAKYVQQVPVVDGFETTPDEWSAASAIAGDWRWLAGPADTTNNRFAAVWNDRGLFLLHRVDYGLWADRARNEIDFGYENLNLFFDPNRDGESNDLSDPHDTGVDGYQIAINQPLGESEISPQTKTAGVYTEAHVNVLFGNFGAPFSQFGNMVVKQTTSNTEKFGYTEIFIPWSDFDATDPDDGFDPQTQDTGLFHPDAPADGEEWYFNLGRIQTNGILPAWSSPLGASFFASRPHGVLRFSGTITTPGDFDGDGDCDAIDIDTLSKAVRENRFETRFDVNSDGALNNDDRVHYIEVMKHTYFGDSNLNGEFGTSDFVFVFQTGEYEDEVPENSGWADGDWSGDGNFTSADFVTAFQTGGFEVGPRVATAAVPEPSAAVGGALAWVGFVWRARRRLSKTADRAVR